MKNRELKDVEDMAEYWINKVLNWIDEPYSENDRMQCLLFSLLYIGRTMEAIDLRLMHMETLMRGIYDQDQEKDRSWNTIMSEINRRWRKRYAKQ